jgi:Fe-S-cluster containining protein
LTIVEAMDWLDDGGNLAIFCEARPWPSSNPPIDPRSGHQQKRSFAVPCGSSEARITAILVGIVSGPCMNLGADLKCRIYARRPMVCRIYPAEISPFVQFSPAAKACPPEAWQSEQLLLIDGQPVDPALQSLIEKSRQTDRAEASQKSLLCRDLAICVAGINDEGYVAHEPNRVVLREALRRATTARPTTQHLQPPWRLYSRELSTLASLNEAGFETLSDKGPQDTFTFLHAPRPSPLCQERDEAPAILNLATH